MPRPIWSGAVSFGLVNIPVKLLSATSDKDVHFHQVHKADGGRIRQKRVCSLDGEEVEYRDIVKGYDLGDGRQVIVDNDELAKLDPEASRSIDIEHFVDLSEIDPVFFERSYYLVPEDTAAKPYALLTKVLADAGRVAVGRFVLRSKQYLVAMRTRDGVLCLSTLRYLDEVVGAEQLDLPEAATAAPSERELAVAAQLVESLAEPFDPAAYHDEYRQKVLDLIEAKAEGKAMETPEPGEHQAEVVDLMAALEASLEAARANRASA